VNVSKAFCTDAPLPKGMVGPPTPSPAGLSKTPTGCGCLCGLCSSAHHWTISVDDINWPFTAFDDGTGCTPGGTGGTVTTPSPNSSKLWGAATTSGKALDIDPWLVLGHELCGHGWLGNRGKACRDEPPRVGKAATRRPWPVRTRCAASTASTSGARSRTQLR
jgi:hypothetical protein